MTFVHAQVAEVWIHDLWQFAQIMNLFMGTRTLTVGGAGGWAVWAPAAHVRASPLATKVDTVLFLD